MWMDHRVWKTMGALSLDGAWGLEDGGKLQIWMDCGLWKMVGVWMDHRVWKMVGILSLVACGVWKVVGTLSLDGLWGLTPLKNTNHRISLWKLWIFSVDEWMEERVRYGETLRQIFLWRLVCLGIQDPNLVVHLPMDVS